MDALVLWLERVLETHPAVVAAVVVAIPDREWQEIGCAFVQLAEGQPGSIADIESYARANLANYKVPKLFRVVREWPTTPSGKVDKPALRERALAERPRYRA